MGYKYRREDILAAAVTAVADDGLSALTFGRLAKRIGISDRAIVYYFPTKADLIGAAIAEIGGDLIAVLDEAFGGEPLSTTELIGRAWPKLSAPANGPVFRTFFELMGLSSAGIEPFATLGPALLSEWAAWLTPRIDVPAGSTAEAEAHLIMATLDGLLLIQIQLGTEAANGAAAAMGYVPG